MNVCDRISDEIWDEIMNQVKPRDAKPDFQRKMRAGDLWSLKVPQLKAIIKSCRHCYPGLALTGNKSQLIDRIRGLFQNSTLAESPSQAPGPIRARPSRFLAKEADSQDPRIAGPRVEPAPRVEPPIPRPDPRPISAVSSSTAFLKVEAVDIKVRSGRCLRQEEVYAIDSIRRDLTLAGHQNPATPIVKLVDLIMVERDCTFPFELDPEDHNQVNHRDLRVHAIPLKLSLQPEAWLQPEMSVYVNDSFVETMPKNWRKKNARVMPFYSVIPLDITPSIQRSCARSTLRLEFPNKAMIWHGLLAIVLVSSRPFDQMISEIYARQPLPPTVSTQEDDEVELGLQEVPLRCPIAFTRLKHPAKGLNCNHKTCFDLEVYLQLCSQQRVWNCPICDEQCPFSVLRIDTLLSNILATVKDPNVSKVSVYPDNRWVVPGPITAHSQPTNAAALGQTSLSTSSDSEDEAPTDTECPPPGPKIPLTAPPPTSHHPLRSTGHSPFGQSHQPSTSSAFQPNQGAHVPPLNSLDVRILGPRAPNAASAFRSASAMGGTCGLPESGPFLPVPRPTTATPTITTILIDSDSDSD